MKLHIIGNSHVKALAGGLRRTQTPASTHFGDVDVSFLAPARFERVEFSRLAGSTVELRFPELTAGVSGPVGLRSLRGPDVFGVCMGLHNTTLTRESFWNSHEPATVAAPGAQPVSRALMDEIVKAVQRHVFAFLLQLRAAGVPSFLVSSPPLRRDHRAIARRRPDVSLEIDRWARSSMREFADRNGIGFVDYPPACVADDGFLREEFHEPDGEDGTRDRHHGNTEYGALMMRRVIAHAEATYLRPD